MTTNDIVKIVIGAFLGAFLKPLIDAYMPPKDDIKRYVGLTVGIIFSYIFPIIVLISLFFLNRPIDKVFVFEVVIYTAILLSNIFLEVIRWERKRMHKDLILGISKTVESLSDAQNRHIKLTGRTVDISGEFIEQSRKKINELQTRIEKLERGQ
ncbi:hypothetical protein AB6735_18665 [Mucilaginibacter sp. RCC_168]|uniref:hypothetical protein n=1 Tax=Mucilaginibacter sp. RCC_168 TaxID=3239221 RepID=UPI003523B295